MKEIRNILKWYPFEQNSNILEIGAENIYLTELLLDKSKSVTSVIFSNEINERYYSKYKRENLEIISTDFNKLIINKKYDYIILIDVIKYFKTILPNSINPLAEILSFCKKYLTENGKILLATDNRFGIKNFSGNQSDNEEYIFQNLEEKNGKYKLYTKSELINIMKELELEFKFYYPFPNFKNASVIFSDDYLPTGNNSKINYNVLYDSKSKVILDEVNLVKQFANNNLLDRFSNSFFIEIYNRTNTESKNDIKYIGLNNFRKEKYKTLLIINDNNSIKFAYSEKAKLHIKNMIKNIEKLKKMKLNVLEEINNDNSIKAKYISNDKLLDAILCKALEKKEINKFFDIIDLWIKKCLQKLEKDEPKNKIFNIEIDERISKELTFVKDGFIDLVFENIFYINDEFIIYDQEWNFENIPLEFIIFRAITNLYVHNEYLKKTISYEKVLERYKLEQYTHIFNQVEQNIQKQLIDSQAIIQCSNSVKKRVNLNELYQKSLEYPLLINEIKILQNMSTNLNDENVNLKVEINNLNDENKDLQEEIRTLKKENDNLKKDFINSRTENLDLNNNINDLKNEIEELDKNLRILQEYKEYIENLKMWKIIKKIFRY